MLETAATPENVQKTLSIMGGDHGWKAPDQNAQTVDMTIVRGKRSRDDAIFFRALIISTCNY
jgi:hypothetical protein